MQFWKKFIGMDMFLKKLILKFSSRNTILISSLFYASYHFLTTSSFFNVIIGASLTFSIFIVGLIWGFLRFKMKSIYVLLINHIFADLGIMLVYLRFIR
jgi:CAAX protease family protein